MKRFFGLIAILLSFNADAKPGDVHNHAFAANPGLSCARFERTFDKEGYLGVWSAKPSINCKLTEQVGAKCEIVNHGIPNLPNVIPLSGNFGWEGELFFIRVSWQVFNLQMICNTPDRCPQLQFYNTTNLLGFACDMHPVKSTKPEASGLQNTLKI